MSVKTESPEAKQKRRDDFYKAMEKHADFKYTPTRSHDEMFDYVILVVKEMLAVSPYDSDDINHTNMAILEPYFNERGIFFVKPATQTGKPEYIFTLGDVPQNELLWAILESGWNDIHMAKQRPRSPHETVGTNW